MSEENAPAEENAPETTEAAAPAKDVPAKHIYLVAYPKLIFLYPTFLASLIIGTYMAFSGMVGLDAEGHSRAAEVASTGFFSFQCVRCQQFPGCSGGVFAILFEFTRYGVATF